MSDDLPQIDPATTALLVMDYQPGIIARLDDPEPVLTNVEHAIEIARGAGARVGYVRVAFTDDDRAQVPAHSAMAPAAASGRALHADAPETQVHDRVTPQDGDIVVRKVRVGAFSTTDLDEQLRAAGVHTLVLAGLSTSGVVLSTVRDGADRDYRMFVLSDASADPDDEVHGFLTTRVIPRQAQVITTAELSTLLGSA